MDDSTSVFPLRLEQPQQGTGTYDRVFLACFAANTLSMTAVSLLFRYSDFVHFCGGSERDLGWIVGLGMLGAILVRYFQGPAMDRWGTRIIWIASLAAMAGSLMGHLLIARVDTVWVYALRVVYMMGVAGAFGASTTFVSLRSPPERMAEMIGTLGSSGFIGMALGPTLGDWLFSYGTLADQIRRMFATSAGLVCVAGVCVALATRRNARQARRYFPPTWAIVCRYYSGPVLWAAAAMGVGLQMPHIFVRAYASNMGLGRIQTFFLVYAATAFLARWLTRRWTDRRGPRWVIVWGLTMLSASMLLQLLVRSQWHWVFPASATGIGHALLFPAVISGGTRGFPVRYRGVAVMLVLAMFDLGALLGQPLAGTLVDVGRRWGWPAYEVMFGVMAVLLAIAAGAFWLASGNRNNSAVPGSCRQIAKYEDSTHPSASED